MPEHTECIETARNLVRRGYFALAASDAKLMSELEQIRRGKDVEQMTTWFSSRSLLAEIHDQTGNYIEVSKLVAYSDDPASVLAKIRKDRDRLLRTQSSSGDSERRLIRAEGLWVLQGAISKLRRFDLDGAGRLMAECQDVIDSLYDEESRRFHGLLSLLHYWQGRVLMLKNARDEAREHFRASMLETEKNLEFHLRSQQSRIHEEDDRVIFAVYSLASSTAFGLAQLSHLAGELKEAINLLHPALAMLMGTGDNYRRAGAYMMMGAASRALAGTNPEQLDKSIQLLNTALGLFGPEANKGLAHRLHEARVQYQLSLAYLYKAQGLGSSEESAAGRSPDADAAIKKALFYNDAASKQLFGFAELGDYADPQLRSDVLVARSRICRYLQKYEEAWANADAALEQVRHYSYAEPSGRANGLIARGEARIAAAGNAGPSASTKAGREELLQHAQADFERAAAIARDVPAIAAVTALHLANVLAIRGNLPEAQRRFQQGWSYSERIENGWVHQLASEVKQRVELPSSVFLLDVKQLEKEMGEGARLYNKAETILRDFMLKRSRQTDGGVYRTPDEAAHYLGVSRPTYFNWSRNSKEREGKTPSRQIKEPPS